MCEPVSIMMALGGLASQALMKPDVPQVKAPEQPPKPQAAKNADMASALAGNKAAAGPGGAMSGNAGTFLTGPGGIDPTMLNLGKNTLLGQ